MASINIKHSFPQMNQLIFKICKRQVVNVFKLVSSLCTKLIESTQLGESVDALTELVNTLTRQMGTRYLCEVMIFSLSLIMKHFPFPNFYFFDNHFELKHEKTSTLKQSYYQMKNFSFCHS